MSATSVEGISESQFRQLLVDIADWYDQLGYINMLKVLYRRYISNYQLNEATKVMELFNLLIGGGNLSSTNLTILYDTVKITGQSGFKSKIKNQLPQFQNISKIVISKFTPHRQKLLKLGRALKQKDVNKLDEIYNAPLLQKYKDSWSLIMDLEEKKLSDETIDTFLETLQDNEMKLAVEALQDNGNDDEDGAASSTSNQQQQQLRKGDGMKHL